MPKITMEQGYKLTSKGGKSLSIIQAKHDWRGIRLRKWRCYTAQPKRKVDDKKNEGYPGLSSETKLQGSNLDKVYQDGEN
jgi:tRNA G37 N-methylase TrmD